MVEPSLSSSWPAAALTALFTAACASSGGLAPADGASVPSASSVAEAAPDPPPVLVPPPAPEPEPPSPQFHCDRGGPRPMLCVAASETEGEAGASLPSGRVGGCGSRPKADICGGCRSMFVKFENGTCCYRGLSRFPRCKSLPPDER